MKKKLIAAALAVLMTGSSMAVTASANTTGLPGYGSMYSSAYLQFQSYAQNATATATDTNGVMWALTSLYGMTTWIGIQMPTGLTGTVGTELISFSNYTSVVGKEIPTNAFGTKKNSDGTTTQVTYYRGANGWSENQYDLGTGTTASTATVTDGNSVTWTYSTYYGWRFIYNGTPYSASYYQNYTGKTLPTYGSTAYGYYGSDYYNAKTFYFNGTGWTEASTGTGVTGASVMVQDSNYVTWNYTSANGWTITYNGMTYSYTYYQSLTGKSLPTTGTTAIGRYSTDSTSTIRYFAFTGSGWTETTGSTGGLGGTGTTTGNYYINDDNGVRWELQNGTWYFRSTSGTYLPASLYLTYNSDLPGSAYAYTSTGTRVGLYTFNGTTWAPYSSSTGTGTTNSGWGSLNNPNIASSITDTNGYLWTKTNGKWYSSYSSNYTTDNPAKYIDNQGRVWVIYAGTSQWSKTSETASGSGTGSTTTTTNPNNLTTLVDTNGYTWTMYNYTWTSAYSSYYNTYTRPTYIDATGTIWTLNNNVWSVSTSTGTGTGTTTTITNPNSVTTVTDTKGYVWTKSGSTWSSSYSTYYASTGATPTFNGADGSVWYLINGTWQKLSGTGGGTVTDPGTTTPGTGTQVGEGYTQYVFNGKTYTIPTYTKILDPTSTLTNLPSGYTWWYNEGSYELIKVITSATGTTYETYPVPTVYELPSGYYYYATGDLENPWAISGYSYYNTYETSDITSIEITDYPVRTQEKGTTYQLKVEKELENADTGLNSILIYYSSDPSVATVDQNGLITFVGEGRCDIVVRAFLGTAETMVDVYGKVTEPVKPVEDVNPNTKTTVYDSKNYGWRLRDGVWTAVESATTYYEENELNPIHISAAGTTWYLDSDTQTWTKTKPANPFKLPTKKASDVFTDINENAWYADAVQFMYEWKTEADTPIMGGTSLTEWGPNGQLNRAQFVVMMARMAGVDLSKYTTEDFDDIDLNDASQAWYASAVAWASQNKIVNGKGEITVTDANGNKVVQNVFKPGDPITRAEACVILMRYAKEVKGDNIPTSYASIRFSDKNQVAVWAQEAVSVCDRLGFIDEHLLSGNKFNPNDAITRAEVASLIAAYAEYFGK